MDKCFIFLVALRFATRKPAAQGKHASFLYPALMRQHVRRTRTCCLTYWAILVRPLSGYWFFGVPTSPYYLSF